MRFLPRNPGSALPRAFVLVLTLTAAVTASWAVLNDNTVKGAATHHAFSSAFGDSVDTLSGQLHFQMPIGPSFTVSDNLKYQVTLAYTSKVLRYNTALTSDPNQFIDGRGQAGVGFYLQLGRIFWKWESLGCNGTPSLVMQFADGTEHEVATSPGFGESIATDLSFLKAIPLAGGASQGYVLATPDGLLYDLDHWVSDPTYDESDPNNASNPRLCRVDGHYHDSKSTDIRGWYVRRIHDMKSGDPNGHMVTVEYDTASGREHLIQRVSDSTGRTIQFVNATDDSGVGLDPGRPLEIGYVKQVRLPAFGVTDSNSAGAEVYSFDYGTTSPTDDLIRPGDPNDHLHTLKRDVFLKTVHLPVGHQTGSGFVNYQMGFDYIDHDIQPPRSGQHIGVVTTRTLPSGVEVQYGYGRYDYGVSAPQGTSPCGGDDCFGGATGGSWMSWDGSPPHFTCQLTCTTSNAISVLPATAGVAWKTVIRNPDWSGPFDSNAPIGVEEDTWNWNRDFTYEPSHFQTLSNPYQVIETDAFQNQKVTYFSASIGQDPNQDPDHVHDWKDGLPIGTEYRLGRGTLLRGEYQDYEDDTAPGFITAAFHSRKNRRVSSSRIVDWEAGQQGTFARSSGWDSHGHYTIMEDHNLDSSLYRTRKESWNAETGTYQGNPLWILDEKTKQQLDDASGAIVSMSEFGYDGLGKVKVRIDRGGFVASGGSSLSSLRPGDILSQWKYYGDTACNTAPACDASSATGNTGQVAVRYVDDNLTFDPSHDFAEILSRDHTTQLTKRRLGVMTWFSEDKDSDPSTGLVTTSRDTAGIPTSFQYDVIGRLTRVTHGTGSQAEAPIIISYPDLFTTVVSQRSLQDPNDELKAQYSFDQFYHLVREQRWMEDGRVVSKSYRYDALGRKTFESEWGSDTVGTTYDYSYGSSGTSGTMVDPFDRVHRITTADGAVTETTYQGQSSTVRVKSLGADPNLPFDAVTVYSLDPYGRLVDVSPSMLADPGTGLSSSPATEAQYAYDVRDNLFQVTLLNTADSTLAPQHRYFTYDALGRLKTSTNSENGTETNNTFSAAGDVLQRQDPAGNLFDYTYDAARRLLTTTLTSPGSSPTTLARLYYDTYPILDPNRPVTVTTGASAGKVVLANTITTDPSKPVLQKVFNYSGRNGRLSDLSLTFENLYRYTYSQTYDDLGQVATTSYPFDSQVEIGGSVIRNSYSRGFVIGMTRLDNGGQQIIQEMTYNNAGGLQSWRTGAGIQTNVLPDARFRPLKIQVGEYLPPPPPGDPNGSGDPGGGAGGDCGDHCIPGIGTLDLPAPYRLSLERFVGQQGLVFVADIYDSGQYRYDAQGNVVQMGADRFRYDASGRLLSAQQAWQGAIHQSSFLYDPFGNMTLKSHSTTSSMVTGPLTVTRYNNVDPMTNRLRSYSQDIGTGAAPAVPQFYDHNANLVREGDSVYTYDAQNRLAMLERKGAVVAEYCYDEAGNRIIKKDYVRDHESYYVRDQAGRLISELGKRLSDSNSYPGWARDYVYSGDKLMAAVQDATPSTPGPISTYTNRPRDPNVPCDPNDASVTPWVRLTFPPNPDVNVYDYIISKTAPGGTQEDLYVEHLDRSSDVVFEDRNVVECASYTYSVRALNLTGIEGTASKSCVVIPGDSTRPAAPNPPTLLLGDRTITLTWVPKPKPPDFYGYRVYRRVTGEALFQVITPIPLPVTKYVDKGSDPNNPNGVLTTGFTYDYELTAVDTAGLESLPSPIATTLMHDPHDTTPPAPPQGLGAFSTTSSIDFLWSASTEPDFEQYSLLFSSVSIDPNAPCTAVPAGSGALVTYVTSASTTISSSGVSPLSSSTTYYARVCAKDAAGNWSRPSAQVQSLTKNASAPAVTLSALDYGVCSLGYFSHVGDRDVTMCTLPGNPFEQDGLPPTWLPTPFSHLNYLHVHVNGISGANPSTWGFHLYKRRSAAEVWNAVAVAAPNAQGTAATIPGVWPWAMNGGQDYYFFGLVANDFSSGLYQYGVAGMSDYQDPSAEGNLDPNSVVQLTAPLPAPEDIAGTGFRYDPNRPWPQFLHLQWAGSKASLRADYAGVRVYRQQINSSNGLEDGPIIEVTDQPDQSSSIDLGPDQLGHQSVIFNFYVLYARTVSTSGAGSKWSNAVCLYPSAEMRTGNHQPGSDPKNYECRYRWLPDNWNPVDPNYPSAPTSPPPGILAVPPRGESVYHVGAAAANRIRVYKEVGTSSGLVRTLMATLPGDDAYGFSYTGWQLKPGSTIGELEPKLGTDINNACDPNTSLRASWMDYAWRESPLSAPLPLPVAGRLSSGLVVTSVDPSTNSVDLSWGKASSCSGSLVGYNVYKAQVPTGVDCGTWVPSDANSILLTSTPDPNTTYHDGDAYETGAGTTGFGVPPAPVSPGASTAPGPTLSTLEPVFQWRDVLPLPGQDAYSILIEQKVSGSWIQAYYGTVTGYSLTLPAGHLQLGGAYRWKVKVHNSTGWTGWSSPFFFTEDAPPEIWQYWVRAVGAPGNPNALGPRYPVCVTVTFASFDQKGPETESGIAEMESPGSPSFDLPHMATDPLDSDWSGEEEAVPSECMRVVDSSSAECQSGPMDPGLEVRSPDLGSPTLPASLAAQTTPREGDQVVRRWSPARLIGQLVPRREVIFYHTDHLGTPVAITDQNGATISIHKYLPFGEEMEPKEISTQTRRFTGHERDTESGLDYMLARYYSATQGRFLSVDPGGDTTPLDPQSWNKFSYVRNNPVNLTDPTGKYVGVDDATFTIGGALVGLAGQAVSDLVTGNVSGWEEYAGAAVGGAAGGEALLYTGPVGAGAVGGAATNLTKQALNNITGKQDGFDAVSLASDTVVGAATGLIPGAKVAGVTTGRGSFNQVFKQIATKAEKGAISTVTPKTAAKMVAGRAVATGLIPGAGAGAVAAGSGALPSAKQRKPPKPKEKHEEMNPR